MAEQHDLVATELVQLRQGTERRTGDRRSSPRRAPEVKTVKDADLLGRISTAAAAVAAALAIWCVVRAPTSTIRTACSDTLGDEVLHHRQIHPLWIVSAALCVLAIVLPNRPRRSYVSVGLVGLTLGTGIAAILRVASWRTGTCLV